MGSPRKHRKKFSTPSHPWQKERILAEKEIAKAYGIKRKHEIWKMNTILKGFTSQAKKLITTRTNQAIKERDQLLKKLASLGLVGQTAKIEDILGLTLNNVMDRRLQTILVKKHLARSLDQARQFITHQHVMIADKKITSPSYMVRVAEEKDIQFSSSSSLINPEHPERKIEEKKVEEKKEESKKDDEKKETKKEDKKSPKKSDSKETKSDKKGAKKDTKKAPKKEEKKDKPNKK